jgi:hypothetical protein
MSQSFLLAYKMTIVYFTTITDRDTGNEDTFINRTLEGALQNVLETLFDEWTIEVNDLEETKAQIRAAFEKPTKYQVASMHIEVSQFDSTGRMYPQPQSGCVFEVIERTMGD